MKQIIQEELNLFGFNDYYYLVVPAVLITLTTLTVSLRVGVRLRLSKSWGVDDWLFISAYVRTTRLS